ncbi:MAG: VOC family protein [Prosthecobacter sp.]
MSTKKAARKAARKASKTPATKKPAARKARKAASGPVACTNVSMPNPFHWNELLATEVKASRNFYAKVFGWTTEPFPQKKDYFVLRNEKAPFGGIMKSPTGKGPAQWVSYVAVKDFDGAIERLVKLGGKVVVQPFSLPSVGKLALVRDPHGAVFGLHEVAL